MIQETDKKLSALVVEGGGMRGIFTAGVLDTFLKSGFNPFDMYFGVSVGASTLSSFLAGQRERHLRIFTEIACRPEFMSIKRMIRGGSFMDLDWLWDAVESVLPLDTDAIDRNMNGKDCRIVCTSVETGLPVYIHPKGREWIEVLKASSALPILYRHFPVIEGRPMADGGLTDPIPVLEAYTMGARRVILIRTRPLGVRKHSGISRFAGSVFLRKYPGLKKSLGRQAGHYNKILDILDSPPQDLEIIQVAPGPSMKTKRTSANSENLMVDYREGVSKADELLKQIT